MLYYEKLLVWKNSMDLVQMVYKHTQLFPKSERFGLVDQMRRCSVSIPSNIAEGAFRDSKKDFIRFLNISLGSCSELKTQITISKRLGYLQQEELKILFDLLEQVLRLLLGFKKKLAKNL